MPYVSRCSQRSASRMQVRVPRLSLTRVHSRPDRVLDAVMACIAAAIGHAGAIATTRGADDALEHDDAVDALWDAGDQQVQMRPLRECAVHGGRVGQWRSVRTRFTCGVWAPAAAPPLAMKLRALGSYRVSMAISSRKIPLFDPRIGCRGAVWHRCPLSCPPPLRVFNVQRIYPSGTFAQWRRSSSLSSSSPAFPSSRSGPSRRRKNEADKK